MIRLIGTSEIDKLAIWPLTMRSLLTSCVPRRGSVWRQKTRSGPALEVDVQPLPTLCEVPHRAFWLTVQKLVRSSRRAVGRVAARQEASL